MVYDDRNDAGRQLAQALADSGWHDPVVLALPRGGVPVAWHVARTLDAPLDVLVTRKIGAPDHPELGLGAVSEGGAEYLDEVLVRRLGLTDQDMDRVRQRELAEIDRQVQEYRGGRGLPDVRGRTLIVVDDGLATGGTARAALLAGRQMQPDLLALAVPVGAPDTVEDLRMIADEVVCPQTPTNFTAVGRFYRSFNQIEDPTVLQLLADARRNVGAN